MAASGREGAMARVLRTALARAGVAMSDAGAAELVARMLEEADREANDAGTVRFAACSPVLRIFDVPKAREFYCDFLGFSVVFEHRFEPGLPLYMGIERAGLALHLSGHHGDACPGATVFVETSAILAWHDELAAKRYGFARPGLQTLPWGTQMEVRDPFGNRLRFCQGAN